MNLKKNVVLLGKGSLAIRIADWCKKNHNLLCVVPELPEPTWTDSLSDWCKTNQVPLVSSGDYKDLSRDVLIDLAVSVFYGKIFPPAFINRCTNIINLHNSPLPYYRGVRPINWALKNNEKFHGVTIHKIEAGIDNGPILGQVLYPLYPEVEEVEDVYRKALDYGWLLFQDIANNLDYALRNARPQSERGSYYSLNDASQLADRSGPRRTIQISDRSTP